MALSYLRYNASAPEEWRCWPIRIAIRRWTSCLASGSTPKRLSSPVPPLIKAYLRLGAFVGNGAVVDHQFGTTDVLIVLPVANIDPRYFEHYGAPDEVKSRIAVE